MMKTSVLRTVENALMLQLLVLLLLLILMMIIVFVAVVLCRGVEDYLGACVIKQFYP